MNKKILALMMASVLLLGLLSGCGKKEDDVSEAEVTEAETYFADIEIADYGTITVELDAKAAPITVENFVTLAKDGFYDGLTFHRIVPGFVIQGGDPLGNGTGGPGWHIPGEFAANGFKNDLQHVRGVLSWARAQDPNSAGSQFFIMVDDAPYLDGNYAAFGRLTDGLDVVDQIVAGLHGRKPVMQTVTIEK